MNTFTLIKENGTREEMPFLIKQVNGIDTEYVSEHISRREAEDPLTKAVVITQINIEQFEEVRKILGSAIPVNALYRTREYQQHLIDLGYKAAKKYPPHCTGDAMDMGLTKAYTIKDLIEANKTASKRLGLPAPRLGYKAYNNIFLHRDHVYLLPDNPCPTAWAPGVTW